MILVLNVCREKLHYYEFVRPIEDVLRNGGFEFETFHYRDEVDFSRYDKVIICGTSLKDNGFVEAVDRFLWLKDFPGKVLGICAGFQILGKVFGCEVLRGESEIGFFREKFEKEFLGLIGEVEVYHLHSNYLEFGNEWEVFAGGKKNYPRTNTDKHGQGSGVVQAVKMKDRDFYGVLFHPEVRNKKMILEFVRR